MHKSLKRKVISSLGLMITLTACGDGGSSPVPPGLPPAPTPTTVIEPKNAQTVDAGGPTLIAGPSAPAITLASLDLKALNATAWASKCYRFSDKGDYSKKFWSFAEGSMNSLLLRFKNETCTEVSTPTKAYGVWNISSIKTSPLSGDWSVVNASCTSGNCSAVIDVAFRMKDGQLHEGQKDLKTGNYYIDEGRFVAYTKTTENLDKLAADANGSAPVGTNPTSPTAPSVPAPIPVSTEGATGLGLLASLAGKNYSVCITNKATREGVVTSSKRSLAFAKAAELAADSYTSANSTYPSTDCTGEPKASAPWTFNNLVVKPAEIEGWISLEARSCVGTGCKAQKALLQLTTAPEGFNHAGEDTKNPGKFFTDSPRVFILAP